MRPAVLVSLCLGVLAACGSDANIQKVTVQWMDWPAEVNSGQAFRTRLVVWGVCAVNPRFHAGASADQSAVTFEPFFVVDNERVACVQELMAPSIAVLPFDTAGLAPGLSALVNRTYEMRAAVNGYVLTAPAGGLPVRTFGEIAVKPSGADIARRTAVGFASRITDIEGCSYIRPGGAWDPSKALVLEDQADTADLNFAWVRGYIYDAAAPVCGQTTVFHLVARGIN